MVEGYGRISSKDNKRRKAKNKTVKLERENRLLNSDNTKLRNEFNELDNLNTRISNIFDADTLDDAKHRFNILYNQRDFLPDEFVRVLNIINKDLESTLAYIENENIPKTNNWLELFFRVVFPKRFRNRFKTVKGVDNFLRLAKIRWNERVVLGEKVEIDRNNIWDKLAKKSTTP